MSVQEFDRKTAASAPRNMSEAEWQARVDCAAAHRFVAHYGWTNMIYNHVTMRVPDQPDHFLLKPHALMFEEVSGKGKLASWCTFERPYYGELMPVPYDTIVVELDEGPWFIANPLGFSNSEAQLGMPVKVSFIDCEDTQGAFKLPVFEKA